MQPKHLQTARLFAGLLSEWQELVAQALYHHLRQCFVDLTPLQYEYDSFASEYRTVVVIKSATDAAVKALNFRVRIAPIFGGVPLENIWWYDDRILKIHMNRIWKLNCQKLIVFHHLEGSYYK